MKLQFKIVRIRMRDGATILNKRVPAWEAPVVLAVWPDAQEVGDVVGEALKPPSVQAEYDRMAKLYSTERDEGGNNGPTFVASVYGAHGAGLLALKNAMLASVLPDETPVTPPEVPAQINQDLIQAIKPEVVEGMEDFRKEANARLAALTTQEKRELLDHYDAARAAPDLVGEIQA